MNYIDIETNFYEEHPDIQSLSESQIDNIRKELNMKVYGTAVPKPCISFAHFGLPQTLMEAIRKQGYSEPTGIQKQVSWYTFFG